ncbi:hypothetical protein [Aurantibacillus circumpalustris]|uniref:hypothetical protein n=1 Tax=Aurantibacillus circumpalustris TaxID=3036359 RepID=UPI00295C3455|nr:hypothetical protein [Aurantibacillus circumpalustris]
MDIKVEVLKTSLYLENITSAFLAKLIGIDNVNETYSFSNKGSALSFSQKIHLLIDVGALSKEDKNKFFTFLEIRNQFMHNINAESYEQCVSFLSGKKKFLLEYYTPEGPLDTETHLKLSIDKLSKDIVKLTKEIFDKIQVKVHYEIDNKVKARTYELLEGHLHPLKEELLKKIDNDESIELATKLLDLVNVYIRSAIKRSIQTVQQEINSGELKFKS